MTGMHSIAQICMPNKDSLLYELCFDAKTKKLELFVPIFIQKYRYDILNLQLSLSTYLVIDY